MLRFSFGTYRGLAVISQQNVWLVVLQMACLSLGHFLACTGSILSRTRDHAKLLNFDFLHPRWLRQQYKLLDRRRRIGCKLQPWQLNTWEFYWMDPSGPDLYRCRRMWPWASTNNTESTPVRQLSTGPTDRSCRLKSELVRSRPREWPAPGMPKTSYKSPYATAATLQQISRRRCHLVPKLLARTVCRMIAGMSKKRKSSDHWSNSS